MEIEGEAVEVVGHVAEGEGNAEDRASNLRREYF